VPLEPLLIGVMWWGKSIYYLCNDGKKYTDDRVYHGKDGILINKTKKFYRFSQDLSCFADCGGGAAAVR